MKNDRDLADGDKEDEEPTKEDLPEEKSDADDAPATDELNFCELCGASEEEDDEEELLRCEECGRLHCASCREYDDEGTPFCLDCYDELMGE